MPTPLDSIQTAARDLGYAALGAARVIQEELTRRYDDLVARGRKAPKVTSAKKAA